MSASNAERGAAEAVFEDCKAALPDALVLRLLAALRASPRDDLRAMCAVLLRRVLTKDDVSLWPRLAPATQAAVKAELLQRVRDERAKSISKKLCDTVAELAAGVFEDGLWPELLPFMFACVSASDDRLREAALLIFAQLAQYIAPSLVPYLATLHGVLHQSLASSTSSGVRIAALRATACFVQMLESPQQRERFQDLLPGMMSTLSLALQSHEEAAAQEALELFIDIAGTEPRFLRRQLQELVHAMLQIAEAQELDEGTRHLAVEFLITLAEAREQAPGMMRKLPQFVGRLFTALMAMLVDIEDDPAWHSADGEDDDGQVLDSGNYEVGQECLDRLSISLGGNSVLPVASQLLPPYLADQSDWRKRHAALVTLAQVAEGCAKVMVKNLDPVVSMILESFRDPHPRVRWAAINAIGQLSTDLGPDIQQQHHQQILPSLVAAMDDFANPRVQAHAAAAVLNFSENCNGDIMAPYLDGVISKLLTLLQSGKRVVQEGALTALASVADCSQMHFQKYYDTVMPYLKTILINANDKSHRMLRAKSMECISLVGMAVGKDKFREDAKQVMDVLVRLQGQETDDDDPTSSYMLQAWARLCKCLGQEFLPYMHIVMPPLLHSAQLKPDVTITDAASDGDADIDDADDDSIETITIGDKRIGIRTSVLEEKATACNMLCCYADELKEGFYPWIDKVAPILVPLLKFYFHEEVRKAAVSAIPDLLRSGKLALEKGMAHGKDHTYLKQLLDYLLPPLLEALHKEPETEICANMLESVNEVIQVAGPLLDSGQIRALIENFKEVLAASMERTSERAKRKCTEDFDEEEEEMMLEENEQEEEVLDQVAECLGSLIKIFKGSFVPYFDELVESIQLLLGTERAPEERKVAICVFDDIAEHFGDASSKYYPTFMPPLLEACTDVNSDVRQAAVYGVGVCAQLGGDSFRPVCTEALTRLTSAIGHPEARSEDNRMATDNAISALGKLCEHRANCIDASQATSLWLSALPLRDDLVEARIVHAQLCSMAEASNPHLLGPNNQNLPRIVSVFAEVLGGGSELATEETSVRMITLLRHLQQAMPRDALNATWARLEPRQQATLQALLGASSLS
eukprot:SM000205S06219  [mRNA]  locus=s205:248959:255137:+ [translate_table: standard]